VLRLAVVGDVHLTSAGPRESSMLLDRSADLLERALEAIARRTPRPDLVIQMGDIIDGEGLRASEALADVERAVSLFDGTALRWTWILGNHDVAACRGRKKLLPYLRRGRTYGELVFRDNVLLFLDSAIEKIYGRIGAEQQAWLEQALASYRRRRIFVFLHHVFDWSFEDDMYVEDGETIHALLQETPAVKAVFMAHAHTNRIETIEGMHEITTGALCAWPLTFRYVEIERDRIRITSEKPAIPEEIESRALDAYRAHPKPWRPDPTEADLEADLPLR